MNTCARLWYYLDEFLSKHTLYVPLNSPPRKSCSLRDNVKNIVEADRPQVTV